MRTWHVLSSTWFDFAEFARNSAEDRSPRHLLPELAERLGAEIYQPSADPESGLLYRAAALIYGQPQHWKQAVTALRQVRDGDSVYAAGCDSGIPMALVCMAVRRDVSFAIAVADVTRPRTRAALRLLKLAGTRLMLAVTTSHQAEAAKRLVRSDESLYVIHGQTDCDFFRPAETSVPNSPPLVASCGVEQRDYDTLCEAMDGLEAEAIVCFASPNRSSKTRFTRPERPPSNVDFRPIPFLELRSLYQKADLVALPLLHNEYSAGLTTLFEAMACGCPVAVTRTPGIISTLIDRGLVVGVPVGDARAMTEAIEGILSDPQAAQSRATNARLAILERFSGSAFVDRLEKALSAFVLAP